MKQKYLQFLLTYFIFILAPHFSSNAQEVTKDTSTVKVEKPWKYNGNLSLAFNQVSLTNWVAGGQNTISGTGAVMLSAKYHKGKNAWDSVFELGYGLTKQGDDKIIKNDDRIDFSSKYGRNASKKWYYSTMFGFKTQFSAGYKYPNDSSVISNFMAPGYFILSVGMDYKQNDKFSILIAPATGKLIIVNSQILSDKGSFGVKPGEKHKLEMGGFIKIIYNEGFWKQRLNFRSKLELFSNYMDNPQNTYINSESNLDVKISNYITASVQLLLLYDDKSKTGIDTNHDGVIDKQVAKLQAKEFTGIGFSYKF